MVEQLNTTEIATALQKLDGWNLNESEGSIQKNFKFKNFNQAWGFMTRIALLAEKMHHHPEWSNIYNRVDITLKTHDADGISTLDIDMANKIELYYA